MGHHSLPANTLLTQQCELIKKIIKRWFEMVFIKKWFIMIFITICSAGGDSLALC